MCACLGCDQSVYIVSHGQKLFSVALPEVERLLLLDAGDKGTSYVDKTTGTRWTNDHTRYKTHTCCLSHTVYKGNRSSKTVRVAVYLVLVVGQLSPYGNAGTSRCFTPSPPPPLPTQKGDG